MSTQKKSLSLPDYTIETGSTWERYLNDDIFKGNLKFVSCKATSYGYIAKFMTSYITLYTKKIYCNDYEAKFAKIVTITEQNYRAKYQTTVYYNSAGNLINCEPLQDDKRTRAELKIFNTLQQ